MEEHGFLIQDEIPVVSSDIRELLLSRVAKRCSSLRASSNDAKNYVIGLLAENSGVFVNREEDNTGSGQKSGQDGPKMVTLFQKCPKPYNPGKDIVESLCDPILSKTDSKPIEFLQPESHDTECDVCEISTTSETSSSESSRTYKFIKTPICECRGEPEEVDEPKLISICVYDSEEERTADQEPEIECTLAIIKPEAVVYREEIERRMLEEGFEIYQRRWLQLSPEQVSEFFSDHYGELNFARLVAYMSSGPIIVHVLAKQNAIADWKMIIGPPKIVEARLYFPDSIRAKYGRRGADFKNAVHGSSSREQAENEIHFFFPELIIEPLPRNEAACDYLWKTINSVLTEALSLCCKTKPADPLLWLANWLILNNPNKPKLPEDLALIPS